MKKLYFLVLLAAIAGCKSKPATRNNGETEVKAKPASQNSGYSAMRAGAPSVIPTDWPLTREEHDFLAIGVMRKALDPKELEAIGLHSRKKIVDFAYRVLDMDLSPVARDILSTVYLVIPKGAYTLLGYYGSEEDAKKHFEAVKAIDGRVDTQSGTPEKDRAQAMIETLGYYVMRDHFMPQEQRQLVEEIDQYLERCSDIKQPSCWPYEGMPNAIGYLPRRAFDAFARSCSDRAQARIKDYMSRPEGTFYESSGRIRSKELAAMEALEDQIKAQLPPVLPEAEIDR